MLQKYIHFVSFEEYFMFKLTPYGQERWIEEVTCLRLLENNMSASYVKGKNIRIF